MKHDIIYEKYGCKLLKPRYSYDERGSFCETLNEDLKNYLNFYPLQENTSVSLKNVVRGLHIQYKPHASKLVRVSVGKILDIAVDCRPFSPTFGQHVSVEITSENGNMFFIPSGFAHGFLSLEDNTVVNYHVSQGYNPAGELSINAFSKELLIDWRISKEDALMSEKDKVALNFESISWKQFY